MITPGQDCFRRGGAAWAQKKGAFRFASREASHVSSLALSNFVCRKLAALLTRTSRRPKSLDVSLKRRLISEILLRSAGRATERRPRFSICATASAASGREERLGMANAAPSAAKCRAVAG